MEGMTFDIRFNLEWPIIRELNDSDTTVSLAMTEEEMSKLLHGLSHALLVADKLPEDWLTSFCPSAHKRAHALAIEEVQRRGFARDVALADFDFDFLIALNETLYDVLFGIPQWETYRRLRREAESTTNDFFHSGAKAICEENARGRWSGSLVPIDGQPGKIVDGAWSGMGNRFKTVFSLWTWVDTDSGLVQAEYSLCLYRHYACLEIRVCTPHGHNRSYRVTKDVVSGIFSHISGIFPDIPFECKAPTNNSLTLSFETLDRDKSYIEIYFALLDYLHSLSRQKM